MLRQHFVTLLLLLALGLWPVAGVAAQGAEQPQLRITQVDNSQFPNVTVYISATNAAGEPVGIDPAQIELFENGQLIVPAEVTGGGTAVGGESVPVTTMLVMDISGSMDKSNKLAAAKDAAKSYVSQMRAGDQAGLITYDTQVYTVQPLTTDTAALMAAIDGLQTGSDTAMYNALVEAQKALEGVTGRKAILVLTDGLDNKSQATAEDVIANIGESGLTISTIGFGEVGGLGQTGLNEVGLKNLAERSGGTYGFATDAEALKGLFQEQSRALQSEYRLTFVSPLTLRDGINRGLTVALANSTVATQGQYNPGGVLPEVAGQSWPTFVELLLVILLLLGLPTLIGLGAQALNDFQGRRPQSRATNRVASQPAARGRIKLK